MRRNSHPLHVTWLSMRKRCYSKTRKDYKYYGAKGISVCKEWDDFWVFVKDVGDKPSKDHTLDRINSLKDYSKDNCRWATRQEQTHNRRIKYECYKGHRWTKRSTLFIKKNGINIYRKCKICLDARIK